MQFTWRPKLILNGAQVKYFDMLEVAPGCEPVEQEESGRLTPLSSHEGPEGLSRQQRQADKQALDPFPCRPERNPKSHKPYDLLSSDVRPPEELIRLRLEPFMEFVAAPRGLVALLLSPVAVERDPSCGSAAASVVSMEAAEVTAEPGRGSE